MDSTKMKSVVSEYIYNMITEKEFKAIVACLNYLIKYISTTHNNFSQ